MSEALFKSGESKSELHETRDSGASRGRRKAQGSALYLSIEVCSDWL